MLDPDRSTAARWLATQGPTVLVEVVAARGSVPRDVGTRMLVGAAGIAGTIGGGHLEWQAIAQARERLAAGATEPADWSVVLGPSLGQCCGGTLTLRFTLLTTAVVDAWPPDAPRFHLRLFGAGHVGRALVQALAAVPCRITWIDAREAEFPSDPLPPQVRRVCVEPAETDMTAEVAEGRPGDFYLVLTHSHALDLGLAEAILRRGDFGWFGLIGSASKRARFVHRLAERGIAAERIARMVCPIGLPGIAGKQPGVIALAVAAQLLGVTPWPYSESAHR